MEDAMDLKEHWDLKYSAGGPQAVSWYEPAPAA